MSEPAKVGGTVWVYDENRRHYAKDETGRSYGGPIWREHWKPETIVGETPRSWLLRYGLKVPKKNANPRLYLFSQHDIDEAAYVQEHRHELAAMVRELKDASVMRQVATLVGYVERTK